MVVRSSAPKNEKPKSKVTNNGVPEKKGKICDLTYLVGMLGYEASVT